ncbi:MFS transporter [Nostocoides jenkinsii]|uniref:Putative MFS-type efflux protein n=1 Tax=Nostocoides jenkinsii Ben 74 TaxID=1193518 RepID=A0A077M5H3_9MICO
MAGAVALTASLVGLAVAATDGYLAIAAAMVGMTLGLRVIMTICAIALVNAMPANRTSIGAALNDTAQEIGTCLGIAVIGTVLAAAMGAALPAGVWSTALASQFFQGERAAYLVLAVLAGVISLYGASTLTDSRDTKESARA